ncbi:MAG: hypothetical protein AB7D39_17665 [Pseudodesulfovibrio sp.]|uniref:hypothetical protein n=1 Tax=Pseudodesulfovibrio sp. TaxID=2035812 RepID=UPI003D09B8AD
MKELTLEKDANLETLAATGWSDNAWTVSLVAGVDRSVAVPTGAKYAVFSAKAAFYTAPDRSAEVTGDILDGTAPKLMPGIVPVSGVTDLHLFAESDTIINIEWWG